MQFKSALLATALLVSVKACSFLPGILPLFL